MNIHQKVGSANIVTFGRRKVRPRICIADSQQHIRIFLSDTLEDLGFVTSECENFSKLTAVIEAELPDLLILGLTTEVLDAVAVLERLANKGFDGKILLLAPRGLSAVTAVEEYIAQLGLSMLPTLHTPFGEASLRESVAMLVPTASPPEPTIHLEEALREDWLELWYQPEINARSLAIERAEALIRVRHPRWGIVPPAYFIPDDGDPHFHALSEYVIQRALEDWRYFAGQQNRIQIAINLPIAFLTDAEALADLCDRVPDHPSFDGLVVEINGTEIVRNLELATNVARQLRFRKIGVAIDDIGAEWHLLSGLSEFPFVEIKVDRKFVTGCAEDRLKQSVCRRILALADSYGASTVAEGIETRADFLAAREMGFDKVQGFYFARPTSAKKFARSLIEQPSGALN